MNHQRGDNAMNTPFGNRHNRVDEKLRADAPQADEAFVRSLARELGPSQPAHRRSRLAFVSAFTVIVIGAVASFGGVGYAANQAATAAKNAVTHKTSAQGQYKAKKPVQPAPVVKGAAVAQTASSTAATTPAASATASSSSDTLPVTGLSLIGTLALGGAMVGVGIALRRRESRD
jgi:cobalamin biosynthesis Mg chelatase CobN